MSLLLDGATQHGTGPMVAPVNLGTVVLAFAPGFAIHDNATARCFVDMITLGGTSRTFIRKTSAGRINVTVNSRSRNWDNIQAWTNDAWQWMMVRFKKTTDVIELSLSGQVVPTGNNPSGTWGEGGGEDTTEFTIGSFQGGGSGYVLGKIAWFSLYEGLLDDDARTALFAGAHPSTFNSWIDTWPLVTDALSLNGSSPIVLTGSPTFDAADNPTVSGPPKGSGDHLSGADSVAATF